VAIREKRKVLVGDDAGLIITQCAEALEAVGYTVSGAESGERVLERLREESFDLVLLDYRLPDIDGFEVFTRARALQPDLAFVLITAYGTTDVIDDATELGFTTVLLKPFTREQLRGAVENALVASG